MTTYTAFEDGDIAAQGDLDQMILAQREAITRGVNLLIFDDATGAVRDVDLRTAPPPTRGRPKMGVKSREVTLLPRHWEWLARQRGGASAELRRLVEAALRQDASRQDPKAAKSAAYRFLSSIAGDMPGYEEALRALFADDPTAFDKHSAQWPKAVADYARKLAGR